MKTNVYIDGFNFHYACWKNWYDPACHMFKGIGPYKWVDFRTLSELILPNDTISRIYYFTANVKGSLNDPNKPARQEVYFRALRSMGMLEIQLGHFEERQKIGRLAGPLPCRQKPACLTNQDLIEVIAREEKGSDVNLATSLLRDAFLGKFEQALIISNDSDLASAVRVVRVDAKLPVHVVSPWLAIVRQLRTAGTSAGLLDKTLIPNCQLPTQITLTDGTVITKPATW